MKTHEIIYNIYIAKYFVYFNCQLTTAEKDFDTKIGIKPQKALSNHPQTTGKFFYIDEDLLHFAFWFNISSKIKIPYEIITHETYHATNTVLQLRGIAPATHLNDEIYAIINNIYSKK